MIIDRFRRGLWGAEREHRAGRRRVRARLHRPHQRRDVGEECWPLDQKTFYNHCIVKLFFDHFQLISGGEYPVYLRPARLRRRVLRHRQQQLRLGRGYHGEARVQNHCEIFIQINIYLLQNLRVTWSEWATATGTRRGTVTERSCSPATSRTSRGRESCHKRVIRLLYYQNLIV